MLLLILLPLIFAHGCSFRKYRTHMHEKRDECICTARNNSPMDSNITIDPHCDCSSSGFGIVRKVQYGCTANACGTIHVDFSSACVRCGMCMAIAEEINQTLLEIHYMMVSDDWLNDTEIVQLLRTICDHSFQHYGLREIDGKRFISDPLPGDKLVTSSVDGLWETKLDDHIKVISIYDTLIIIFSGSLKNMCHDYLNEIQELQLYSHWKEWCEDDEHISHLEDILCREQCNLLEKFKEDAQIRN